MEITVDANDLVDRVVRVSPHDGLLVTWGAGRWTVRSPNGAAMEWTGGPPLNDTAFWDLDSSRLLWIYDNTLLTLDSSSGGPEVFVVDGFGSITADSGSVPRVVHVS